MPDPITVTDLKQTGRTTAPDPNQAQVYVTYNADFAVAADVTLDFTVTNQQAIFGTPRGLFVDNSSNPSEVEVSVSQTDMFFTIPPYAEGYFKLDAAINSRINFVTDGGATDKVTITVYNYEVSPNVWYRFGAFNRDVPIKAQGTQPTGTDMDTADNNYPILNGGVDSNGILRRLLTDNTGRLLIVGSGAGNQVYGPDAAGVPPTQPPILNAGFDGTNVQSILVDSSGRLIVNINGTVSVQDIKPSGATKSSIAGAAADTLILAANSSREGATIYNDSSAILYLSLGTVAASVTSFTTQIAAGGYYEVPAKYTGQIRGIWASATGNARITEIA